MWNIPAEQTCSRPPHFHFCREDLSSIVTWVLRDFSSWRRQPRHASRQHTHGVVRTLPRFSVAKLRVLITKRGANRNVSPQSLVFTFGPQPHRKVAPRRRIPSRRRSYQTCKAKIIHFTKQRRFSHCEIHYKVVTFVCKFKKSTFYTDLSWPLPPPPRLTLRRWIEKKVFKVEHHFCSSLTGKHQPTRQITLWTLKITCVFMWTLSCHVLSTIFNSTGGRKAVSSSDVYLLTPKMENITTRGDSIILCRLFKAAFSNLPHPSLATDRHRKPAIKRKETMTTLTALVFKFRSRWIVQKCAKMCAWAFV